MVDSGAGVELAGVVQRYIEGHSRVSMRNCLSRGQSRFAELAADTDALGWDSFVEGRIAKTWEPVVKAEYERMNRDFQAVQWGACFVDKLLQLTHRQWILRNTETHFRLPDGFTLAQHEEMFNDALTLWRTLDPDELLERHQHLLRMSNEELGKCSPLRRRVWVADVESALAAKTSQQRRTVAQSDGERRGEDGTAGPVIEETDGHR